MVLAREYRKQLLATLSVNALTICYGVTISWSSASMPVLLSDASPLPSGRLTTAETSWVSSIVGIGGLLGNISMCYFSEKFGRKTLLVACAIPHIFGWSLTYFAQNVYYLYVSRLLQGLCGGALYVLAPIFVAEISDSRIRGTLGAMFMLSGNFGIMFAFVLGHFVPYLTIPLIMMSLTSLSMVAIFCQWETPQYLMRNGYEEEAEKALRYYRNADKISDKENGVLQGELTLLKSNNITESDEKDGDDADNRVTIKDLVTPAARKALTIGLFLLILKQFSGLSVVVMFAGTIFAASGSSIAPNLAAIVIGVAQLLGTYTSVLLVDRAGRKVLLTISTLGAGLSLLIFGIYAYLRQHGFEVDGFGWLPVTSVSSMLFFGSCGILPMPFVVMSEVMPAKIRSIGTSIGTTSLWASAFVAIQMFYPMMHLIGLHGCMFFYAGCTFVGTIFVNTYMIETKGKSLEEISRLMEGRPREVAEKA